jgi:hypothetical protein
MKAKAKTRFKFTLDQKEAESFASVMAKVNRPHTGFQRPEFDHNERDLLDQLDRTVNPQDFEQTQ